MRKIWCKLWNWILNTVSSAVELIAHALKTVGDVAVDLLTDLGEGLGSAVGSIFGGSNFIVWAGVGVFAYFFLTKEDKNGDLVIDRFTAQGAQQNGT